MQKKSQKVWLFLKEKSIFVLKCLLLTNKAKKKNLSYYLSNHSHVKVFIFNGLDTYAESDSL